MLEQYADGDESFKSDCSFVKKALNPASQVKELSPIIKSQITEVVTTPSGVVQKEEDWEAAAPEGDSDADRLAYVAL